MFITTEALYKNIEKRLSNQGLRYYFERAEIDTYTIGEGVIGLDLCLIKVLPKIILFIGLHQNYWKYRWVNILSFPSLKKCISIVDF